MKTAYALCWTPDGISLCVVVKISVALLLFLVSVYILPFVHKRKNIREFGVEPLLLRMEEVEEESQGMNTTAYILLTVGLVTTLLLVIRPPHCTPTVQYIGWLRNFRFRNFAKC